jgi:hypothetical protein
MGRALQGSIITPFACKASITSWKIQTHPYRGHEEPDSAGGGVDAHGVDPAENLRTIGEAELAA